MYIIFAVAGIMFLFWDLNKKAVYKLVLSGACLFSSIFAFKYPKNYIHIALIFLFFTLILNFLIKTILKKEQYDLKKNNASKDYKGKIATVKKDIGKFLSIDGIGLIEFDNNIWQAKSIDDKEIKANSKVEIVSKENMIMNVKVVK